MLSKKPKPQNIRNKAEDDTLSFYHSIGAPLMALVQAESQAMQATVEYIEKVGFVKKSDELPENGELGELRMLSFKYNKPNSQGQLEERVVQVPLLSIVPIPVMQIKHTDLEYSLNIVNSEKSQIKSISGHNNLEEDEIDHPLSNNRIELKSTIGQSSSSEKSMERSMKVKMRIEQSDIPVGITRMLNILNNGISDRSLTDYQNSQKKIEPN